MPDVNQNISFIYVSDITVSARFFEESVGLELVLVQPAGCRVYRLSSEGFLGICQARPDQDLGGSGFVLCMVTDDVDDSHARLTRPGVACDGPPRQNVDYGIYHFYFTDPDGNLLEVQRFIDPNWSTPNP